MINEEIARCLAEFFNDRRGPSHDELTRAFLRFGLSVSDSAEQPGDVQGKKKRLRRVLTYCLDNNREAGDQLVLALVPAIKATGAFRSQSPAYAGKDVIEAAQEAFRIEGYDLDNEGNLRRIVLNDLDAPNAPEVLRGYIDRARRGEHDAALVLGTGKDLLEATARHVLVRATGSYPSHDNFQTTLYQAFYHLGLKPSTDMLRLSDQDPNAAIQESLFVLGNAINRLRNAQGTGHGRPFPTTVNDREARTAVQAMALISQMLLDRCI